MIVGGLGQAGLNGGESLEKDRKGVCGGGGAGGSVGWGLPPPPLISYLISVFPQLSLPKNSTPVIYKGLRK